VVTAWTTVVLVLTKYYWSWAGGTVITVKTTVVLVLTRFYWSWVGGNVVTMRTVVVLVLTNFTGLGPEKQWLPRGLL